MMHLTAGILSLVAAQAGPVGWWRGDDGAAPTIALDSSGNGRNGTYTAGATNSAATLPPGLFNNASAFQFDGVDDQISIPHNAAFNLTGNLTVAFWMRKTAEQTDWVRLVGKGASTVRTIGVWEEAGAGRHILFQQYNAGAAVVSFLSAGEVAINTWTHVACTVDTSVVALGSCQIYLDGVASGAAVSRTAAPATDTQPVRIGYGEIHTFHPGQMDEVRLFDRVLSTTEIQTLAGLTVTPAPTGLNFTGTTTSGTTLNWTAAAGAASYVIKRSTDGGPFVTIATGVSGVSYTDSPLNSGSTYTYAVYAVGLVNSADSVPNSVVIPFPPPRTNDHSEGLLDENCSCGSTAPGTSVPWAVLAGLALLAFRRR